MEFNSSPRDHIRIASFDIGKKNFAQYIEDASIPVLKKLEKEYKSLPVKLRRRVKGPVNPQISKMLDEVYTSSQRVQTGVYDFRHDKTSKYLDMETRKNLIDHLESFLELWDSCNVIVIEQQYFKKAKGKKGAEANVDAIKFAEATLMWFLNTYPFKKVLYFGSQNKTQILGAPWKMTKPQRKKWAVEKTREIYKMRKDEGMIELFNLKDRTFKKRLDTEKRIQSHLQTYPMEEYSVDCGVLAEKLVRERQKLDDIGDACVQAQAFKFRNMIALF